MKKPSEIETIDVKYGIIPPRNFLAITWFGNIIINKKNKEYWEDSYTDEEKQIVLNHEMIHVKQAEQEKDSWLLFYMKYLHYWMKAMLLCGFKNSIAYYCIPYEIEAHVFEEDFSYIDTIKSNNNKINVYKSIPTKTLVNIVKNCNESKYQIIDYIKNMY